MIPRFRFKYFNENETLLKNKCLEVIKNNFHTFYNQFKSGQNGRNLEFLQRAYSFELARLMCPMIKVSTPVALRPIMPQSLPIESTELLINKYIKFLDTAWLKNLEWDVVAKMFAEIGPNLEEISFLEDDRPWEELFVHLYNIKKIGFLYCKDSLIESVAKYCPNLESIWIGKAQFSRGSGLKTLCCQNGGFPCAKLREILINGGSFPAHRNYIQNEDLAAVIQNNSSLELVRHDHVTEVLHYLHKNDMDALHHIKPYKFIDQLKFILWPLDSNFSDMLKICANLCLNVKLLYCFVQTEEHLTLVTKFTQLQVLALNNYSTEMYDINSLLKVKQSFLTTLKIHNFTVLFSTLLKICPHLHNLCLKDVKIQYREWDIVPTAYYLENLQFEGCHLNRTVAFLLSSSPNLENLAFVNCESFSPHIEAAVLNCCEIGKLKDMCFLYSSVNSKFAQDILLACPSLTCLNLAKLPPLTNSPEEKKMLRSVAKTLPNNPKIIFAWPNRNVVEDTGDTDDEDENNAGVGDAIHGEEENNVDMDSSDENEDESNMGNSGEDEDENNVGNVDAIQNEDENIVDMDSGSEDLDGNNMDNAGEDEDENNVDNADEDEDENNFGNASNSEDDEDDEFNDDENDDEDDSGDDDDDGDYLWNPKWLYKQYDDLYVKQLE